ncbi:uncharacterized protein F5147DRAFT_281425 [Suillus discolor]|uniref:Uncharacterized protein n=1 Tax=Suillus discolor TaxID=1912936 RepID=A0A9P7F2F2_9AGAM|nr:uncharacterized protein F5147DRAFT_281425 [Suillus discolor]KAG2103473.1 hypothetical protein F5147DRAFT_281425 [Suillus discolor]
MHRMSDPRIRRRASIKLKIMIFGHRLVIPSHAIHYVIDSRHLGRNSPPPRVCHFFFKISLDHTAHPSLITIFLLFPHFLSMHLLGFFTCIASCLSVARAFSVTVGTPTVCEPLSISWTGGQAPFEILLAPSNQIYQNIQVPASAFSNGQGSYSISQLSLLSGTSFVLIMSDATGFGSGGTTNKLTVASSAANCGAANPSPPYTFDLSPLPLTQCSQFNVTVNGGAVPPITIGQIIPGGLSVLFNSGSNTFSSTLDVSAGTSLLYFVNDSLGNQGGVSPYEVVSGSSVSSCLNANSPSSTPNTPATITATVVTTTQASPSSSSSSSSNSSSSSHIAIIAGAAGGGGAVLIALAILGICLRRKRKASRLLDVQSSTQSYPRHLQRTDPNYEAGPHSDVPPQFPFAYKTDPLSYHTRSIHPSLGTQSEMTNSSAGTFAVGAPLSPFNQTQHSRQSSNTDFPVYGDTRSSTVSSSNSRQLLLSSGNFTANNPHTPFNQTLHSRQSSNADMYADARSSAMSSVDRRMATVAEIPSPWETVPVSYLGPSIQPGSQPGPINASATNMATRDYHAPFNQTQPSHMSPNTDFPVYGDAQMSDTTPAEHMAVGARPASPLPRKVDLVYLSPPVEPGSQSTSTSTGNVGVKNPPTLFNQSQNSHQSPDTDNFAVHGASGPQSMTPASAQTAYQPPTRIIVHTDADDVVPDNNGVVELPPQYSEHRGIRAS